MQEGEKESGVSVTYAGVRSARAPSILGPSKLVKPPRAELSSFANAMVALERINSYNFRPLLFSPSRGT